MGFPLLVRRHLYNVNRALNYVSMPHCVSKSGLVVLYFSNPVALDIEIVLMSWFRPISYCGANTTCFVLLTYITAIFYFVSRHGCCKFHHYLWSRTDTPKHMKITIFCPFRLTELQETRCHVLPGVATEPFDRLSLRWVGNDRARVRRWVLWCYGSAFRITYPLWGESIDQQWFTITKDQ